MKITSFRGPYAFLSNFYGSSVVYKGITYPTAEHAYQAAKTSDPLEKRVIQLSHNPGEAKRMGQIVTPVENWDELKVLVMFDILTEKFKQNITLRRKLIYTVDAEIVEGNSWHDNFWGDCSCPKCKDIEGQNTLGKLLMRVRKNLNEQA